MNSVRILNVDTTDVMDLNHAEIEGTLQIPGLIKLLNIAEKTTDSILKL